MSLIDFTKFMLTIQIVSVIIMMVIGIVIVGILFYKDIQKEKEEVQGIEEVNK